MYSTRKNCILCFFVFCLLPFGFCLASDQKTALSRSSGPHGGETFSQNENVFEMIEDFSSRRIHIFVLKAKEPLPNHLMLHIPERVAHMKDGRQDISVALVDSLNGILHYEGPLKNSKDSDTEGDANSNETKAGRSSSNRGMTYQERLEQRYTQ
jgi:hypothetical protein